MHISKGDARALASKIRERIHHDIHGRQGIGDQLDGIDTETRQELDQEHTKIIAEEIEAFFA